MLSQKLTLNFQPKNEQFFLNNMKASFYNFLYIFQCEIQIMDYSKANKVDFHRIK